MSSFNLFRPYYYGAHKWDDYLLDIQDALAADVGLQQDIAKELAAVRQGLESGLAEMRASFEWGFTLLAERMDAQVRLLSQTVAKLDAIHKTLESPLTTQARELFNIGQERMRKGLLDKALQSFRLAEEKNDVDFILQLQMGKLLLYGRNRDSNVVDPVEAEKHLLAAARYADAEKESLGYYGWVKYYGQALFHAAVAAYVSGSQEHTVGRPEIARDCQRRALSYLDSAVKRGYTPTEIIYFQAKCHALLGTCGEALERLRVLSDRDRRYCAKASHDPDLQTLQARIREIFESACSSPGNSARLTFEKHAEAKEMFRWAKIGNIKPGGVLGRVQLIEEELSSAERALGGLDADIDYLHGRIIELGRELGRIASDALEAQVQRREVELESLRSSAPAGKLALEELQNRLKNTTGGRTGCLFMVMTVGACALAFRGLGLPLEAGVTLGIVLSFPVYFIVNRFAPSRAEREIKTQINEKLSEMDARAKEIPNAEQRLEEARQQLATFQSWRHRVSL
jgi:tetratricopeptide (TPR) repeat protein